jgi:cell division septal protein FtsQ
MSFFDNNRTRRRPTVDYHEKKLENPFYKRREHIISFAGIKGKLTLVATVLILIFIVWFIFISQIWAIKKISTSGIDQMSDADVRDLISQQMHSRNFVIFPQSNLLFFSEKKFQDTLQKKYHFQKITIKKGWPSSLEINIISKPLVCVWNEGDKYYYTDSDGYAVQEINPLDLKDSKYPLITNQSSLLMYGNRIAVDPSYINFAANLKQKISQLALGIAIDRFVVNNDVDTIQLICSTGPKIIFSTKDDVDKQLANLAILKNQKLKDDFNKQQKIDLSFGDKIYYQ